VGTNYTILDADKPVIINGATAVITIPVALHEAAL
jgi:hypothetical protein